MQKLGGRVVLHFLPPYCPEHNRIEIRWKALHAEVIRNHRHPTMARLMAAVEEYLSVFARKTSRRRKVA